VEPQVGLGVSRDGQGRVEIFILGAALSCSRSTVAANVSYNEWERADAGRFTANRLVLPAQPHFDAVAAFLCAHLLENGLADDVRGAFLRTEPVIEMVFERSRVLGDTLVGLVGELLVLRALVTMAPSRATQAIDGWSGHIRSSRDFQLHNVGVEVKTTRGATSRHQVSGVRQVEVGRGVDGTDESYLYLASIGIEPVPDSEVGDNSWTLPSLVDNIIDQLRESTRDPNEDIVGRLLVHIRDYGEGQGEPYDHREAHDRIAFSQPWRTKFARFYDMTDDKIDLPKTADLDVFSMLDSHSVEFVVRLPAQVDGDLNPIAGLLAGARQVVGKAWPELT
ncbi:MAG: PD-(D/E)XK motif protein, partial [Acidimicrobiia bacterium]